MTLKTKICLITSILVTVMLSLAMLYASWQFEKQLKDTISRQQFTMIAAMAEEVDSKILSAQQNLAGIARALTADVVNDPKRAQDFLDRRQSALVVFDRTFIFSPEGKLVASNPPDSQQAGKDFSFRDYIKNTLKNRSPQISEPFLSVRHDPVVMFTAPTFDETGKINGIAAGSLNLMKDNFLGKLSAVKIGKEGYLYLYNTDRTIIMHVDRNRILKQDVPHGVNRLFDRAIEGFEGTGETVNSRGLHLLSSFKRLKTTNWILAANYLQSEAYLPIRDARKNMAAGLILALSLAIPVIWSLVGYLTKPLLLFIRHVRGLTGKENELEPIHIRTQDEIGSLAVAFNQLVAEVNRQKKAVQSQEEFCRNLLQNSAVPTFVLDREHRVIIWNRACEELTGLAASDVMGTDGAWRPFYGAKRPVIADIVMDGNLDALSSHYSVYGRSPLNQDGIQAEGWYPSLNGKERFIFFDAAPVRDGDGNIIAAIETLQDLTERKQAEESLRKLSQAIHQTPITVILMNRDGVIEYVNPHFTTMTGYGPEEAIGVNMLHEECAWHRSEFQEELLETVSVGDEWYGEFCSRRKDGSIYWQSSSVAPVLNTAGEITHLVSVQEDISERKWAEEELRKSDEQIRLLLHSTAEAILGLNLLGNCTFANPACARLLGYQHPDQLIGRNMHYLIHHTRADGTAYPIEECPMLRVFSGEKGVHVDDEILWRLDGTSFSAEYWSYPQKSGDKVVGAVMTFLDITERKLAEEQLSEAKSAAEAASTLLEEKNRELNRLSREDEITGLTNRRYFNKILQTEINRALRTGQSLSLLMCDVDFFKRFNDQYGHIAGDKCLKAVGRVLKQLFKRAGEVPSRYGGEEFTVILPNTEPSQAALLAEKLRAAVMAEGIPHGSSDAAGCVTVSIGIVAAPATSERDMEWYIHEADKALYKSKEGGRNRYTLVTWD